MSFGACTEWASESYDQCNSWADQGYETCTTWADQGYETCSAWADQGYTQCTAWQDQGYNACTSWSANCCDWWPCSWFCQLITWVCVAAIWISNVVCVAAVWVSNVVCVATVWISNLVCVATVWVSNLVCLAWTTVTTLVCLAYEVVNVVLTPIAVLIELILSIPIIGRILDELRNLITTIAVRIASLPEALASLVGIRPLKKLRLCIVILRDEKGPTSSATILDPWIEDAKTIFLNEANVEIVVEGIHTVTGTTPDYALDVGCNADAWGEDLWLPGSYFKATSAIHCAGGAAGRLLGVATPLVAFCVREIPGTTLGCALGPLNDYLTIEGADPKCLAHEIGHKVGLWHCCPGTNLANGVCGGTELDAWQVAIIRSSKYVSYV